jgi:tetratricopeptide (TPR) repeat protein
MGCAASRPITKLVNDRRIVTRSVHELAYEHAIRAFLYEEQERWADAALELQRAISIDDESPELLARLAEDFMRLGRLNDAKDAIRASLAIEPTADGLLAEAHLHELQGDGAAAVQSLTRAVAEADFGAAADRAENVYLELAQAQILTLDLPAAENTLSELCRWAPSSTTAPIRLMAVSWALGDLNEAERRLDRARDEDPNNIEVITALAWIYAASGRSEDARAAFRDALDRSEGSLDVAAAEARFLGSIGDSKQAEQVADDLVPPLAAIDPDALPGLIELERSARRLDKALALVHHGQKIASSAEVSTRLTLTEAALLKEHGRVAEAASVLLAVRPQSQLYVESRLHAAELLRDAGRFADAVRAIEQAAAFTGAGIDRDKLQVETAVALAFVDEKRGDAAQAVRRLETLLGRQPNNTRLIMALAMVEERRGSWRRALDLAETLIHNRPGSVEALNFWGFVAADHKYEVPLALGRLQAAVALEPGAGGLLDSLGWAHLRLGQLDKAALFLEQAGRLEPVDAEILGHLGQLYELRADKQRAAVTFRRALALNPDDRLRRQLEEGLARVEPRHAAER